MLEIAIIYGITRLIKYISTESGKSSSAQVPLTIPPPQKIISLVGSTGAGKSSTGNALANYYAFNVGAEHGTTNKIDEINYLNGYKLRDTPGLLDGINYKSQVLNSLKETELVIYTTAGQLYRQEMEIVSYILEKQKEWNNLSPSYSTTKRKTIIYVNMEDTRIYNMPSVARDNIKKAIFQQFEGIIQRSQIAFGAATPILNGKAQKPQIDELKNLITESLRTI
jgi:ribosome biogenesis GTPase A